FRDGAFIFLAALLVGDGLVVVAVHNAGRGAGDELQVRHGDGAVHIPGDLQLGDDRVLVAGIGVAAEGPVAHGVEYVVVVVDLDGLERVRVRAVDDVGASVDGGVALFELQGIHVIGALVAPVQGGDDELGPGLLERGDARLYLRYLAEGNGVDADLEARFRLVYRVLVAARVAYARGVERGLRVRVALLAVVLDVVVAEGDEFHAAQREDVHIQGRGAEGEVLVRRHVVVREHALEVRHREVVVLKVLYGLFKDVAEVVCRDHVLVGDGGVPVIRHGVWGDVPDEADVEDL